MKPEDRIVVTGRGYNIDGKMVEGHYFSRFIEEKTEMWFFGTGIGDQTLFQQMGDGFLEYCDTKGDPELGRIICSMGLGAGAFTPYKGDYNVCWPWGVSPENLRQHLSKMSVQPDLIIGPWKGRREAAEDLGIASLPFSVGVGRLFKPLGLPREGLGYAGLDNKSEEQRHIVLGPVIDRPDFEWRARGIEHEWLTVDKLNQWYNSKQILFGMIEEVRLKTNYLPSRFPETLASGTPLILYKVPATREYLGFEYPYMTESYEETEDLIIHILGDYETILENMNMMSELVRTKHRYMNKLDPLFDKLRELK